MSIERSIQAHPYDDGAGGEVYVVQEGDTLARIAASHGISLRDLLDANPGIGGNLACLGAADPSLSVEQAAPPPCPNPRVNRFLNAFRWHERLQRLGGGAEARTLEDAKAAFEAARQALVDDLVRRARETLEREP